MLCLHVYQQQAKEGNQLLLYKVLISFVPDYLKFRLYQQFLVVWKLPLVKHSDQLCAGLMCEEIF